MTAEPLAADPGLANQFTLRGGPGHRFLGARGLLEGRGLVLLCFGTVVVAGLTLIATLVDATGLIIYFRIAKVILHL